MNELTEKSLNGIARAISIIFNPAIMPTLGIILIFNSSTYLKYVSIEGKQLVTFLIFFGTFLLPLVSYPILKYLKLISNLEMPTAKERILPYTITLFYYFTTFMVIQKIPIPFIKTFMLSVVLLLAINIVFLFFWKISTHAIGAGGIAALMFALIYKYNATNIGFLLFSILIAGLVASARLQLKAHSQQQVYMGLLMGFLVTLFLLLN